MYSWYEYDVFYTVQARTLRIQKKGFADILAFRTNRQMMLKPFKAFEYWWRFCQLKWKQNINQSLEIARGIGGNWWSGASTPMEFLILAIIVQKFCHYFWKLLPLFFNILAIIVEYFGHYCWKIWPLLLMNIL